MRRQRRASPAVPPYGPPILEAIAKGNLREMKALVKQAEAYLGKIGDLQTALTMLKVEIAKREKKA